MFWGLGVQRSLMFQLGFPAKQGWKLISNPFTLLSKVLKAKYFNNCSFMEAKLGSNPSFTWRSILEGREVLKLGIRRRIGDGKTIKGL